MPRRRSIVPAANPADEQFLRDAAARIKARINRTVMDIIDIGRELIDVKERIGHGNFLPWIDREFGMTDRTAQNFMNVASRFQSETVSDLTPSVLYELAAPSTPDEVCAEIVQRGRAGERVTRDDVRQLKAKLREKDSKISELRRQRDAANAHSSELSHSVQVRPMEITDLTRRLEEERARNTVGAEQAITRTDGPVQQDPAHVVRMMALMVSTPEAPSVFWEYIDYVGRDRAEVAEDLHEMMEMIEATLNAMPREHDAA